MSIQDQIRQALSAVTKVLGISIRYTQGNSSVSITAVPGESLYQSVAADGSAIESKTRDYLIDVCDLRLAGTPIIPQQGDTITERANGKVFTYRVIKENGEQVYSYSDVGRTRYRIHTVLKSEVSQ